MSIDIAIMDGPLSRAAGEWRCAGAGAVVVFEGVVRPEEGGEPIGGLEYEVYEPMASRQMQWIADSLAAEYSLLGLRVEHSRGRVPVGDCSFRLWTASGHRKAGIAAAAAFIDRMKQDVPIWKKPYR